MTKRDQFILMVHATMRDAQRISQFKGEFDFEQAWDYFTEFQKGEVGNSPKITAKGRPILQFMKDNQTFDGRFAANDIGEPLGLTGASVSGSMRKLISDGLATKSKFGQLTVYSITDAGKAALE